MYRGWTFDFIPVVWLLRSVQRRAGPAALPATGIHATTPLIDLETHRAVFTWILQVLATADLVKGKTIGIDATTLEANAALRSIVRRDSGETYQEFLTRLAQASGIETPTRADLARLDRKRRDVARGASDAGYGRVDSFMRIRPVHRRQRIDRHAASSWFRTAS